MCDGGVGDDGAAATAATAEYTPSPGRDTGVLDRNTFLSHYINTSLVLNNALSDAPSGIRHY